MGIDTCSQFFGTILVSCTLILMENKIASCTSLFHLWSIPGVDGRDGVGLLRNT